MLTHIRTAATLAAGVLWFSGLSPAQTGAVLGTVMGPDGNPYQGALIRIERIELRGNYKVKSNKKGKYYHGGLPLGTYNVSVEIDGRIVDTVQNARVGSGPNEIDFDLAARDRGGPNQQQLRQMSPEERREWEKLNQEKAAIISKNKKVNEAANRGMQAYRARDFQTAIDSFELGLTVEPEHPDLWGNLALSQGELAKTKPTDQRKALLAQAVASWRKTLELRPDDAGVMVSLGTALMNSGELEEGKSTIAKAVELDPLQGGMAYFNLGVAMINNQNSDAAIEAFEKAIELDPTYADAYFRLGEMFFSKAGYDAETGEIKPYPGTLEAFEKYLELQPNGGHAEQARNNVLALTGKVVTEYRDPEAKRRKRRKK